MSYSDLLKDPRWQKKRLEILSRDNWTCQSCLDTTNTLHVHHKKYYNGKPWEIDNEHLITYCKVCHKIAEEFKLVPEYKPLSIVKNPINHENIIYICVAQHLTYPMDMLFFFNDLGECLYSFDRSTITDFLTHADTLKNI